MSAIVTENLCKTYREGSQEVHAVRSVSVSLAEGEVIGLFGPSGSGKTTLLSMLGCILTPTSGSLRLFGREIAGLDERLLPGVRREYVSFIFQGFNLFPALTAHENVMLGLRMKGVTGPKAERRSLETLEMVGLGERSHFLPRDLSGGQKQRVAVARALAADSPIILADEPTGNLDLSNGRTVMELLVKLARVKKRCIVVATHDNRIAEMFDRIMTLEDGTIIGRKQQTP